MLAWTAVTGASSYNIYQYNGSSYINVGSSSTASATVTSLTNGISYSFEVTAVNGGGESVKSSPVSATPEPSIPAVPTGLAATAGNAQVTLAWTASTGATSYNIYQYNGSSYINVGSSSTTNATVTSLTNGTSYSFERDRR